MTCNKLERYLDGELAGDELEDFRDHLGRCSRCALEVRHQARLDEALAAASRGLPSAPVHLVRRIEGEIDALDSRRGRLTRWLGAAAVLAVGIGVALLLHNRGEGPVLVERPAPQGTEPQPPVVSRSTPVATVVLGEESNALAVPVAASHIDATFVFVYPILGKGRPQGTAE